MRLPACCALLALAAAGCAAPAGVEATSLLGDPLVSPPLEPELRAEREADLERAIVWLGRRQAYLGRYREAVATYTAGLEQFPDSPRLLRHRGHRFVTLRDFDAAVADLARAKELVRDRPDEVEPDGAPNPAGVPRSTLQSNIGYHLGLAHYLKGDFEAARAAYADCLEDSRANDDMLCATTHWLYMTLRRLGRDEEARALLEPIHAEMEILENFAYHELLLMYRGERSPEALLERAEADPLELATVGYGVANWLLYTGEPAAARRVLEAIVDGGFWPAFGHVAAEAELARM